MPDLPQLCSPRLSARLLCLQFSNTFKLCISSDFFFFFTLLHAHVSSNLENTNQNKPAFLTEASASGLGFSLWPFCLEQHSLLTRPPRVISHSSLNFCSGFFTALKIDWCTSTTFPAQTWKKHHLESFSPGDSKGSHDTKGQKINLKEPEGEEAGDTFHARLRSQGRMDSGGQNGDNLAPSLHGKLARIVNISAIRMFPVVCSDPGKDEDLYT